MLHAILITTSWDRGNYTHFTNGKTCSEKLKKTCPKPPNSKRMDLEWNLDLTDPKRMPLLKFFLVTEIVTVTSWASQLLWPWSGRQIQRLLTQHQDDLEEGQEAAEWQCRIYLRRWIFKSNHRNCYSTFFFKASVKLIFWTAYQHLISLVPFFLFPFHCIIALSPVWLDM